LNVQKHELRAQRANGCERRVAVAVLADDGDIAFCIAELAQRAPSGELVVHDDDIHHAPTSGAARRAPGRSGAS
jgi:hypothetical protein